MGLFYDKCVCGNKVPKRARVCSKCGRGAPNGWVKCPACGKWVGNDSAYCPHCNHPLHPAERIDLAGGVWDREPDLFAQRFELGDVSRVMKGGLMVQEGTLAILLDAGKETKILGPGRHTPEGTLRNINWFGNPPPRSAVLVDSGDVVFRVDYTGLVEGGEEGPAATLLRTAEELPVSAIAETTLRFDPSGAVAFLENFMKEKRSITTKDVCAWLYEESLTAVRDLCQQSTVEDLVKDPDRRPRMEEAIGRALAVPLKRCGLKLVRVGAVEFYGKAYEEVRSKYGELDRRRRLVEYEKKQLDVLADEELMERENIRLGEKLAGDVRMDREKRAAEVQDYLDQLAQEKQLTEIDRTRELQIAVRVAKGEVSRVEAEQAAARLLEQHAKEMTQLANKLELDLTLRNYDREQLIADARNRAQLAAIQRNENELDVRSEVVIAAEKVKVAKSEAEAKTARVEADIHEADRWLDVKEKKNRIKNAELRERAATLAGKSLEEVAALAGDPDARDAFLKQELAKLKLKADQAMTPEQLLALAAGTSPEAADALARIHEAAEKASAQVLKELKEADKERHAHDDRILDKMSEVAKAAVEHQSGPVVVPPSPNIVH